MTGPPTGQPYPGQPYAEPAGGYAGLPPPGPPGSTQPQSQSAYHDPYATPSGFAPFNEPAFDQELKADTQATGVSKKEPATAPVVPAGSVTGRSLTLVVSIMCFLACLTAGAVYMVNQAASAWLKDVASEITVQVEPREGTDANRLVQDVAKFLQGQPGIRSVRALSLEESSALIEPWLGKTDALKSLPIPRMIAIELDRRSPPDLEPLRAQIAARYKGVAIDDHRQWQSQIRTVTRSLALGGLAILMLVGAATTAIIISATRSAMASNREIVEVLHFVGATDRFIAREFEKHFLRLGVRAGVVGAVFAMLVFLLLPKVMELLGGGTVSMADLKWMVGSGALDAPGYLVLVVVVVVIACLCMLTSRFGVKRILNAPH
ncbi:MAG: cell division protein FtsX [Hyphomicrobiaceae bacterium]